MEKILRRILEALGLCFKKDADQAYKKRDIAALLLARFASEYGYPVSMYLDDQPEWEDDWRTVLRINLDYGAQVSWHLGPESAKEARKWFEYQCHGEWDGTHLSSDYSVLRNIAKR